MKLPVASLPWIVLVALLAFALQVFVFCPISPDSLELPSSAIYLPKNKELQKVIKLGEGLVRGPEDVVVDKNGIIYTADRDGWIQKLHTNGSWEKWKQTNCSYLLGLTIARDGSVIVCDAIEGLLKVNEDGVTVLASHVDGSKITFADEVIEASDGSLYFTVATTKYGLHNWKLDFLEAKPHGQLLKYDPTLKQTSILLPNLSFPNGVALSKDEDYLVFCETWKCLKFWLKGKSKRKTEIFVEDLPGWPDNVNLAPEGSFWIALVQIPEKAKFVHKSKVLKRLIASSSTRLINQVISYGKGATVVNVDAASGKITRKYDDPDGKVVCSLTSAFEFRGHLYLGGLRQNFIGKLALDDSKHIDA